jgi:hypothetical protein
MAYCLLSFRWFKSGLQKIKVLIITSIIAICALDGFKFRFKNKLNDKLTKY